MNIFQKKRINHIKKICKELSLSRNVESNALDLLKEVEEKMDLSGIPPKTICASIVFITLRKRQEKIMKKDFCKVTGTSSATIRKYEKIIGELK